MQNSSEEEGNTNTWPTQARLTSHIMLKWAPHLTATANSICNRSMKVNELHQLQRISAKVAAPTSILGNDMPDSVSGNIFWDFLTIFVLGSPAQRPPEACAAGENFGMLLSSDHFY